MGMEYAIATTQNPVEVVAILENGWADAMHHGGLEDISLEEELLRCTILHGHDKQGHGGFSFCDPIAPVGWHEKLQIVPLWDQQGNPYIYLLSNCDSQTFYCFLTVTKSILEANDIQYEVDEL